MAIPSVKTLSTIFGGNAKRARKILEMQYIGELKCVPENADYVRACYNSPSISDLKLNALNVLGEFSGVEAVQNRDGECLIYLNAGDTYTPTLVYWCCNYRVASIGDIVENRYNKF